MAEDQNTGKDQQTMEFNIGKSFGLSNQPQKLEDYRAKLASLKAEFIEQAKKGKGEIESLLKELEDNLGNTHQKMISSQETLLTNQEKLITKISQQEQNVQQLSQWAKGLMEQVFADMTENFKRNRILTLKTEEELRNKITVLLNTGKAYMESLEKKTGEYITELKNKEEDFIQFELGYLYGDALRTALSDE